MNQAIPLAHKRAICYSGFRDGQSPDAGVFPSPAEIASDFEILQATGTRCGSMPAMCIPSVCSQ